MNSPAPRTVHRVSELAELLRALVEDSLPRLWVEGEISNFSRPSSGHWYFTLKDERAQIRCAMFRNANLRVAAQPGNGDQVLLRAQASFYTARGDLQLICEHLEPAGQGALLREFEALKRKLSAEGLFDAARKRPIPSRPRCLGLITSATGAAVQDVLAALQRRYPLLQVVLWPVAVQGAAAAPAIVRALQHLPRRARVDAVLLVRGGGSLEDLWAFNEEAVARAIVACPVPVISGVGHEIDFTIADFAADLRAPTPTAAAELASPDRSAITQHLDAWRVRLRQPLAQRLRERAEQIRQLAARLQQRHPQRQLQLRAQALDDLSLELGAAMQRQLAAMRQRQAELAFRIQLRNPRPGVEARRTQWLDLHRRLLQASHHGLQARDARWQQQRSLLRSYGPQAVLDRGYAIARSGAGQVIRNADQVQPGQDLELILARGRLITRRQP